MGLDRVQAAVRKAGEGAAMRAEALATVRETGFLLRLPPALREEVVKEARLVEYPAGGSMIYHDERRRPALVAWGLMRSYLTWREDRQLTLDYHRPGDLFEVLRVRGEVVSEGIQAIEPSGVLQLDLAQLDRLADAHREVALALAEDLRPTRPRLRGAGPADVRHRQAARRGRPAREGERIGPARPRAQGQRAAARRRDRLRPRGGGPSPETAPPERGREARRRPPRGGRPGGPAPRSRTRLTGPDYPEERWGFSDSAPRSSAASCGRRG